MATDPGDWDADCEVRFEPTSRLEKLRLDFLALADEMRDADPKRPDLYHVSFTTTDHRWRLRHRCPTCERNRKVVRDALRRRSVA